MQALENENISIRDEMFRLRATADRLKQEKCSVQDQLSQTEYTLSSIREEQQKLQELGKKERDELVQERVGNARVKSLAAC